MATPDEIKDLNKALNLSMASLVGAIIPIVGLVLAIVASRLAHGVTDDSHAVKNKKGLVQGLAIAGTLMSFAAGYFYYQYYSGLQTTAANEAKREETAKTEAADAKSTAKEDAIFKKAGLDNCLNMADKWWDDNFAGKYASYEQQALNQQAYDSAKADCYKRYPQ